MKYIEHTFKGTGNNLDDWQNLIGGRREGNVLYAPEGTIKEYEFENHRIIAVSLLLTEEVTTRRIMDKSRFYYPIIFSENLTFIPDEDGRVLAMPSRGLSTGIYFSSEDFCVSYPKGENLKLILLHIPYEAFERVLPSEHVFLKHLRAGDSYIFYESISLEMKIILQQLLNETSFEKLNYELARARSWELFALFAEKFFFQRHNRYNQIDKKLLRQLQQVKEFILSDLSAPKSIEELTRFCGMSATKLRASFKEVYGMSIYNLFQEHRMEKARELLLAGDKSVSEVAYLLGYSHLGHFTGAFKQRFQCLPKDLKP